MLRRSLLIRGTPGVGLTTKSMPVYEVIFKNFATSQFDSRSPTAGKAVAILHKNHIHSLGEWMDAGAEVRAQIVADAGADGVGLKVVKVLDNAAAARQGTATVPDENAPKILIAYGSQTGTAEALARLTGLLARSVAELNPVVVSLNEAVELLTAGSVFKFRAVLILCSTYGTGEFATNADEFYAALREGKLAPGLKDVPTSVFGLGNSARADRFNLAAKQLVAQLAATGATTLTAPVYSCELANPEGGHDSALRGWASSVWASLGQKGIGNGGTGKGIADIYNVARIYGVPAETLFRHGWFHANVTYNEVQSARNFEPTFRHMLVEVPLDTASDVLGRKLVATDQLVVHPHNKKPAVERALQRFHLVGEEIVEVTPLPGAPQTSFFDGKKISTRTLFREVIDLSCVPPRSTLRMLALTAENPSEKAALEQLANDQSPTSDYVKLIADGRVFTVLDVLERYPSIKLTLPQAMSRLPHIRARYYSNMHDPESNMSNWFRVLYNVPTRHDAATGRVHKGLATSNMESCTPAASTLWVTLEAGKATFPPVEANAIFVATGSGIGQIMAALEQRATARENGKAVGKVVVIYGFRQTGKDQLFREELDAYVKSGLISGGVRYVASYDKPGTFVSPLDQIDRTLVDQYLNNARDEGLGHLLYCGVSGTVPHRLEAAVTNAGGDVSKMRAEGRWHEEYFRTDLAEERLMKTGVVAGIAAH